jgi:hypothetical protein
MRVFKTTFFVAVDPSDAVDYGEREEGKPLILEEVKRYLQSALTLDWEGEGDAVGIQGMEVWFEELEELPTAEVERLYGKQDSPA